MPGCKVRFRVKVYVVYVMVGVLGKIAGIRFRAQGLRLRPWGNGFKLYVCRFRCSDEGLLGLTLQLPSLFATE